MAENLELTQTAEVKGSEGKNGKRLIGFLAVLLGSILLIAAIFLPFASSAGDYREYLEKNPDMAYLGDNQMNNSDIVDISLFEFGRIYADAMGNPITGPLATVGLVTVAAVAVMVLLTALFSILKKAVPVIVFDALAFIAFCFVRGNIGSSGAMSGSYELGMAQYFFYIGAAVALAGAIVLLVAKSEEKKTNKIPNQIEESK